MVKVDDLFIDLSTHLDDYQQRFITPYLPADPNIGPEVYELDVKAFCLLAHAAFEQYFEQLCLHMMGCAISKWIDSKTITDSLTMLLCRYGFRIELSEDDKGPETTIYDHLRHLAEDVKRRYSNDIHNNHGISPKYLRAMLVPVAIDFTPNPNTANSLCKLSQERGEYAHRCFARRCLAPEDAANYVTDCLSLAEEVRNKATAKGFA